MIEFERVLMLDQRLLEPSLGPKQQALGNPSERMSRLERDCFLDCVAGDSNPMLPAGFPVGKRSRWRCRTVRRASPQTAVVKVLTDSSRNLLQHRLIDRHLTQPLAGCGENRIRYGRNDQ